MQRGSLVLAISDPFNLHAVDAVSSATGLSVAPVVVSQAVEFESTGPGLVALVVRVGMRRLDLGWAVRERHEAGFEAGRRQIDAAVQEVAANRKRLGAR